MIQFMDFNMNKDVLIIKITTLKEVKDTIQSEIDALERELNKLDDAENTNSPIIDFDCEIGYYEFLTKVKKLNKHTANNYFSHLRGIKNRLIKYNGYKIDSEIYNISDKDILLDIKHQIDVCEKLQKDNKIQHNAFTAAFNNYVTFIYNFYKNDDAELPSDFIFDD